MKKHLLLVATLATAIVAAAPASKPIVTLERISAVTRINDATRAAIAPFVSALDTGLQKMVRLQRTHAAADKAKRAQLHVEMKTVHEECHAQYAAIEQNLDPEQLRAFHEYLHAQLEAAGIPFPTNHDGAHQHN